MSQLDNSFGPQTSVAAVTSTGPGSWIRPRGLLNNWGYTVTTAGSTSSVTVSHTLQGTLSESTAPVSADIFPMSTTSGAGHSRVTARLARQVRVRIDSLSSTSSTGPTATVVVGGTL